MAFGFRALNDDAYVQIDAEQPRMCCLYSGTFQADGSYVVTVTFPAPITTTAPPFVFIRPATTSNAELYGQMNVNGSAGNWTGFTIKAENVTYRPAGKWFAAVFASRSAAGFGLRLFDAGGALVYDSGAPAVVVTKVAQNWTYMGKSAGTLTNRYYWRAAAVIGEDEYVMVNPFSRSLMSPGGTASPCAVRLNYAGGYAELYANNTNVWTNVGNIPAVFARLYL